jgi:hypothetical protein
VELWKKTRMLVFTCSSMKLNSDLQLGSCTHSHSGLIKDDEKMKRIA